MNIEKLNSNIHKLKRLIAEAKGVIENTKYHPPYIGSGDVTVEVEEHIVTIILEKGIKVTQSELDKLLETKQKADKLIRELSA